MITTKVCRKHGLLTREQIRINVYKGKPQPKCIQCENERGKVYRAKNPDKFKEKNKLQWEKNKDKIKVARQKPERIAKQKEWLANNKERCNQLACERERKYRKELNHNYVKRKIINSNRFIHYEDIPPIMIELARANILLKRKINEIKLKKQMETINE